MDDVAVGGEDQIGRIRAYCVFDCDIVAVGIPGFYDIGILGCGIQMNLYTDEFIVKIIAGLLLGEDRGGHVPAGAAPGGEAVHENIFVFGFGFRLDGSPAEVVLEMHTCVYLRLRQKGREDK